MRGGESVPTIWVSNSFGLAQSFYPTVLHRIDRFDLMSRVVACIVRGGQIVLIRLKSCRWACRYSCDKRHVSEPVG